MIILWHFLLLKESDDKNDWPEEDGIEIDLSSLTLNTYELSIDFCL